MEALSEEEPISAETEKFHNEIREVIIELLLFLVLFLAAHITVRYFRERPESDLACLDKDDWRVYQVTQAICTFSLSVTFAGILLLPFSIVSNEVLLTYPNSHYIEWLNTSLIQVLWDSVSKCSNATFFILIPFAYLFLDAQGFAGTRSSIWSRVLEAICFLLLFMIALFGMLWVIITSVRQFSSSNKNSFSDLWTFYLPLIHSLVSFSGVLLLLVCWPVGLMGMLSGLVRAVTRWKALRQQPASFDEQLRASQFEEDSLRRKVDESLLLLPNGWHFSSHQELHLRIELDKASEQRRNLEYLQRFWWVPALYLLAIIVLSFLAVLTTVYVAINIIGIVIGLQKTPLSETTLSLGLHSMSTLGWVGACFQIILIIFLLGTSLVGAYQLFPMKSFIPKRQGTSLFRLLSNCTCLLLFSSAIPIQTRILGITNFILLGNYGRLAWLDNILLVLLYNALFLGVFVLYAIRQMKTITTEFWTELFAWFQTVYRVYKHRLNSKIKNE